MNQNGNGLILALISGVVGFIIFQAMTSMIRNMNVAERGVASNLDLSQIINSVRLLTDTREACGASGLLGIDITPLLSTPPPGTPISVSLTFPGGPVSIASGATIGLRNIASLELTSATSYSPGLYLANLRISTTVTGKALTQRKPTHDLPINVTVDGTNHVIECHGNSSGGSGGGGSGAVATCIQCRSSTSFLPFGQPSDGGVRLKRRCSSAQQHMTSCSAAEFPSGQRVCNTAIDFDVDGHFCTTSGCSSSAPTEQWATTITCCEASTCGVWPTPPPTPLPLTTCTVMNNFPIYLACSNPGAGWRNVANTLSLPSDAQNIFVTVTGVCVDDSGPNVSINGTSIMTSNAQIQGARCEARNINISSLLNPGVNAIDGQFYNAPAGGICAGLGLRLSGTYQSANCSAMRPALPPNTCQNSNQWWFNDLGNASGVYNNCFTLP